MTQISVSAGQLGDPYKGADATLKMRIYNRKLWTTSDGVSLVAGRLHSSEFYREVNCTVVGGVVTHAGFTIDSTTNALANPKDTYYTFFLYDNAGNPKQLVHKKIRVPVTTPTTLAAIATYSAGVPANLSALLFYTAAQVDAIIASLTSIAQKATELIYGAVRLSVPAVSAAVPIVIGDNDPRVATLSTLYANSLAAAVAAIGAAKTTLRIDQSTTVAASLTIPANIRIEYINTGQISVNAGQILTIGYMQDPGNKQIFAGAGSVRFSEGAIDEYRTAWWTGPTPDVDITYALDQALASCVFAGSGVVSIPTGTWLTNGGHAVPSNTIIKGQTRGGVVSLGSELKAVNSATMFVYNLGCTQSELQHLMLDGNGFGGTGILLQGSVVDPIMSNLSFRAVLVQNFATGCYLNSTSGEYQIRQVYFDGACIFGSNSSAGLKINTGNCGVWCEATFLIPAGARCVWLQKAGVVSFAGGEMGHGGIAVYPAQQSMTQTVVAPAGITASGTGRSVVTAAGMIGSPVTVNVELNTAVHTTAALIATAFRKALAANPAIGAFFHVLQNGAELRLVKLEAAADDATMNFTIEDVTSTGITDNLTATKVTAGSTTSTMGACGIYIDGVCSLVNLYGVQEEALLDFITVAAANTGAINIHGTLISDTIRLNSLTNLNLYGCAVFPKAIRDNLSSASKISVDGTAVFTTAFIDGGFRNIDDRAISNATGIIASSATVTNTRNESDVTSGFVVQRPFRSFQNATDFAFPADRAWVELMSTQDQRILRVGRGDSNGNPLFYYDQWRDFTTGRYKHIGNQALAFKGYDFDADIRATRLSSIPVALSTSSPATLDGNLANCFTLIPTGNLTINATLPPSGTPVTLIVFTSGVVSFNITFGTNFKSQGVLATGTVDAKYFVVEFISNGVNLIERGTRGAAI